MYAWDIDQCHDAVELLSENIQAQHHHIMNNYSYVAHNKGYNIILFTMCVGLG